MNEFNKKLSQRLNQKMYGKISNRALCEFLGISEATFYRFYGERYHAFEILLKDEVINTLELKERDNFEIFIFRALKRIEVEKYFYLNVFYSLNEDERRQAGQTLRAVSRQCLKKYTDRHEGISKKTLDAYAALVYSDVYSWIIHGFRQSASEIYQEIAVSVPAFEGHRCNFKRKYQR